MAPDLAITGALFDYLWGWPGIMGILALYFIERACR
jgi:hypothetical protein